MANSDSLQVLSYLTPSKSEPTYRNYKSNNKFYKLQLKKPEPVLTNYEVIDLTENSDTSIINISTSSESKSNNSISEASFHLRFSESAGESNAEKESSTSVISGTQQSDDIVEDSCSESEKIDSKFQQKHVVIDESSSFTTNDSKSSQPQTPNKETDTSLLTSDNSYINQDNLITSDDSLVNPGKNISSDKSNISSNDEQYVTALTTVRQSDIMEFTTPKNQKRYSEFKSYTTEGRSATTSDTNQNSNESEASGTEIVIDERTANILNELYGDTWRNTPGFKSKSQTPQTVIKKPDPRQEEQRLTKTEKKKVGRDSTTFNFNDFANQIRPDFESTRTPFSKRLDFHSSFLADSDSEVENAPEFYHTILHREKEIFKKAKPRSVDKKYKNIKKSLANVCDSDSDDDRFNDLYDKYKSFAKPSTSDLPLDRFEKLKISDEPSPKSKSKRKLLPVEQPSMLLSPPEQLKSFEMPVSESPFTYVNGVLTDFTRKRSTLKKNDNMELKRVEENEQLRKATGSDRKSDKKTKKLETPKIGKRVLKPIKLIETDDSDSLSDKDFPSKKQQEPKTKSLSFLASLSANVDPSLEHPEAKKFKQNFAKTKDLLVKRLFDLFNETVFDNQIPSTTQVDWNARLRGTAGTCHNKKIIKGPGETLRTCRIELSTKVVDLPSRVRDTLLHEMCHAVVWLVDGYNDGHGPRWKYWALKAMRTYPDIPAVKRCHNYEIHKKFLYKCVKCGYTIGRHSKSLDTEKKRCGYCYGKFELFINKKGKDGGKVITEPGATSNAFAMFVKDNYKNVKKPELRHGDVMKILGQQFSEMKMKDK